MKLKTIKEGFHNQLDEIYGKEEVSSFFFMLTESYFNFGRIQLALEPDFTIPEEEEEQLQKALKELKTEKPIQYILGDTEFYGLHFKVNKNVLIPRPETEELVSLVIESLKQNLFPFGKDVALRQKGLKILDIGTGSGCIAIALAKNIPNSKVYALDVSAEALKVAKKNAKLNNVEVEFIEESILNCCHSALDAESTFDIIVSNPPYVRNQEKEKMKPNVLQNEPHLALFVEDDDALQFYKAITKFAVHNLSKNGMLFFEINEYLGQQMIQLLKDSGFKDIELKQDIFGKDRMIKGIKIDD